LIFIDLDKKILAFHGVTKDALICLGNRIEMSIEEFIRISEIANFNNIKESSSMQKQCKAAFYWGLILAKEDYTTLLIKLGVKEL
jgi:hypothetical protein